MFVVKSIHIQNKGLIMDLPKQDNKDNVFN